jgi:hypothetical protein
MPIFAHTTAVVINQIKGLVTNLQTEANFGTVPDLWHRKCLPRRMSWLLQLKLFL